MQTEGHQSNVFVLGIVLVSFTGLLCLTVYNIACIEGFRAVASIILAMQVMGNYTKACENWNIASKQPQKTFEIVAAGLFAIEVVILLLVTFAFIDINEHTNLEWLSQLQLLSGHEYWIRFLALFGALRLIKTHPRTVVACRRQLKTRSQS